MKAEAITLNRIANSYFHIQEARGPKTVNVQSDSVCCRGQRQLNRAASYRSSIIGYIEGGASMYMFDHFT